MCPQPSIPKVTQYQESKSPVYKDANKANQGQTGRRGTILTGGEGITDTPVNRKRTILGA
jgi:hypothetical protein